ncbi:MAG: ATP-binding protein, partial [Woeseiaceae bacterium]|nr:ATP-binding protein [Woeseiaceae bacterium]
AADDIREAISTIGRRSEGLINFVSKYRELLKVPAPDPKPVGVLDLFQAVAILEQDALSDVDLRIDVVPESLSVMADRALLEQVLLNLVKNAIDAVADRNGAVITLAARLDFGRTVLSVTDNGPGIPGEILDQVFIPFFTTKREGSGIGLSLSRQVMTAHRGDIVVENLPAGTRIKLVFP